MGFWILLVNPENITLNTFKCKTGGTFSSVGCVDQYVTLVLQKNAFWLILKVGQWQFSSLTSECDVSIIAIC